MSFYYYLDYCLFSASRAFKYHLHSYVSYSIVSIPLLHMLGTIIIYCCCQRQQRLAWVGVIIPWLCDVLMCLGWIPPPRMPFFWYISLGWDRKKLLFKARKRKEGGGHFAGHIYCYPSTDLPPWWEAAAGPTIAFPSLWIFFQLSYFLVRCMYVCVFSTLVKVHGFCKMPSRRSLAIKMHKSFSPLWWSSILFSWDSSRLVSFSSRPSALGTLGRGIRCGGSLEESA